MITDTTHKAENAYNMLQGYFIKKGFKKFSSLVNYL